jgi:hypothetical protein
METTGIAIPFPPSRLMSYSIPEITVFLNNYESYIDELSDYNAGRGTPLAPRPVRKLIDRMLLATIVQFEIRDVPGVSVSNVTDERLLRLLRERSGRNEIASSFNPDSFFDGLKMDTRQQDPKLRVFGLFEKSV